MSIRNQPNADLQIRYRTLSLRVDSEAGSIKASHGKPDPATALRSINAHLLSPEDIFTRFSSHPVHGLEAAAVVRKSKDGKNKITPPPTHAWKKVLNYVFGGFNALMWLAFIVTILSYRPLGGADPAVFNLGVAILLLLVIIVSSTFYAVVDFHASRIMQSIKGLMAENATVIRDGTLQTIPALDIVVGDLVSLSLGDRVPADLRLVQVSPDLKFDRSLLTGESDPIPGTIDPTDNNALETRNLALTSTFVVQGSCQGVVFAIGDGSVMGRIVGMSATKFKMTTIQREVWFFTQIVSGLALSLFSLSIIIWAVWLRTSFPGFETASGAIINSIGCLTAFVPQGLPVCVALSLTIVAKRMAKRHVLVKNLATLETLGCMSILCSDKTGTLTEGKMSVQDIGFADQVLNVSELNESTASNFPGVSALHRVARLCNGARFEGGQGLPTSERVVKGDATDTAILRFAEDLPGTGQLLGSYEKIFEIPFNSKNKWMLTVVRATGPGASPDPIMLIKGAPDGLLTLCTSALRSDGTAGPINVASVRERQEKWSSSGHRVLALCSRSLAAADIDFNRPNTLEEQITHCFEDFTLVALLGIRDPPRQDVPDAVRQIRAAHVRIMIVTGDFKLTALAIARQVGIITCEKVDTVADMRLVEKEPGERVPSDIKPGENDPIRALIVEGADLASYDVDDWDTTFSRYTEVVFARTTPEQKLRIVEEGKRRGDNTVAVTGDGVNDAPALRAADIGVAMGSGSDVAKDAAAMVLLNNDFSSIVVAIENGRLVFDNLKKVVLYLMPAGTYTEFMAVLGNVFLGMQLPLSSYLQVCFSITNDVVMSISLMFEKPEADLMKRRPRNARTDRLTDWRFFIQIYLFIGLMMWPCAYSMYLLYFQTQGFGFYDVVLVFDRWTDGYKGHTIEELNHFVSVGQCIYYVTMVFMQYGGLLAVRNRRVSILQSNPLWGPRRNYAVLIGMTGTALIAVTNLYGPGLQNVFKTAPIPGMFWGLPFAFALGILSMDELRKLLVRTYPNSLIAKIAW